jgi:Cu/Ag efflux protein CusF
MKQRVLLAIAAIVAFALIVTPAMAKSTHNKTFRGEVITARDDAKEVTIKNDKTKTEILVHWSDQTKLAGAPLKPGDHVEVTYSMHHGMNIATDIKVLTDTKTPVAHPQ